jgi:FkbM family methyltransferase
MRSKIKHTIGHIKNMASFFEFKSIYQNLLVHLGFWNSFKFFFLCIKTYLQKNSVAEFEIIKFKNNNILISYNRGDIVSFLEIFNLNEYGPIFEVVKKEKIKPFNLIDLGANIGLTYSYFENLDLINKYVGVEPLSINIKPLTFNTISNNSKIYQKAIWTNNNPVMFSDNGINNCNNIDENGTIKVETITLKEIYEEIKSKADIFLKIDIEGAEYEILDHNKDLIKNKTKYIAIEFHKISQNDYQKHLDQLSGSFKIIEILKPAHDISTIYGIKKD